MIIYVDRYKKIKGYTCRLAEEQFLQLEKAGGLATKLCAERYSLGGDTVLVVTQSWW